MLEFVMFESKYILVKVKCMIIVMEQKANENHIKDITGLIKAKGLEFNIIKKNDNICIGVLGNSNILLKSNLEYYEEVKKVIFISESYKLASKQFQSNPTIVKVGNTEIGPNNITIIARPSVVENEEQLLNIAREVRKKGATIINGGVYRQQTSQYLRIVNQELQIPIIAEVICEKDINTAIKYIDVIQIGPSNMQNFYLLKEVGRTEIPILLNRGLGATIEEWLNAAEYIMAEGNSNVILCEQGIRTFEQATKNTLDLSAIPVLKRKTHLPVIVDPSRSTGDSHYVIPMAKAAIACGSDGIMIEVSENDLSEETQSLSFERFGFLCDELEPYIKIALS